MVVIFVIYFVKISVTNYLLSVLYMILRLVLGVIAIISSGSLFKDQSVLLS